eukprot:g28058.t1
MGCCSSSLHCDSLQHAEDRQVGMRAGDYVEITGYGKVEVMLARGPEVFCKVVIQSAYGYSNVEYAILDEASAIDQTGGDTGEMLLHLERLFRPLD